MALTLDSTLQTAQDQITDRHPIIEIISKSFVDPIPFAGSYFNDGSDNEISPNLISTSTGRIAMVSLRNNDLIYTYTDTDRTVFSEEVIDLGSVTAYDASLVELSDNNIGVIWHDYSAGNYRLRYMTISQTGTVVTAAATIASYASSSYTIGNPYVVLLDSGSYLLTYTHFYDSTYSVQKRTSVDFSSWSAESEITLSGLDMSQAVDNPSLLQITNDDVFLFFDYADDVRDDGSELNNIYYVLSDDDGVTWGSPVKLTSYTAFGTVGKHPVGIEMSENNIRVVFHEDAAVLLADSSTTGWGSSSECVGSDTSNGTDMHYDPATGLLYVLSIGVYAGVKALCGVQVIDVETWTILRNYTTGSTPSYNTLFAEQHVWPNYHRGDGFYICAGSKDYRTVLLINDDAQTVTNYAFDNVAAYGITKNVDFTWPTDSLRQFADVRGTWVDSTNNRLYICFINGIVNPPHVWFGYIDLTESPDPATGLYSWNEIFHDNSSYDINDLLGTSTDITVDTTNGYVLVACYPGSWKGRLVIHSLTTGAIIKNYNINDYSGFPYHGAVKPIVTGGKCYFSFIYESLYSQEDRRGLACVDLNSDVFSYHRPSYATANSYGLQEKVLTDDGRIVIASYGYGITIFDPSNGEWTLFNNDNVPGMSPDSSYKYFSVDYDDTTGMIFTGQAYVPSSWMGAVAFSENGSFNQGKYIDGIYSDSWSFSSSTNLVDGLADYEPSAAVDADGVMWNVWTRIDNNTEYSTKWDRDTATYNLSDYLKTESEMALSWGIDHPNQLTFSLTNGYLFDPLNLTSTLGSFLAKGRKITVRLGENISDIEYWQNQGTFIIDEVKMDYARGEDPIISFTCYDKRKIWETGNIKATQYFSNSYPEDVLDSLLTTHTILESADIDIPTINGRHTLYHQWIDSTMPSILNEILYHFGYIPFFDVDDKFVPKRMNLGASVAHIYTGFEIIKYSPDLSYSTFTNRVIIKGESNDYYEVMYNAENVGQLTGTMGWWGGNVTARVYYSDDREKKVRDPYLNILVSTSEFQIFMIKGGGGEAITGEDSNEKYCDVTIYGPDLTDVVLGTAIGVLALGTASIYCDEGQYCGAILFGQSTMMSALSYALGAIAQYDIEIYGWPVGSEKQTFQATANDTEFQQHLGGEIITEETDDPLCYDVATAQTIADREIEEVKAQRKRVSFSKIAHLQDEICDIIRIQHPHSGQNVDIFITELTRKITIPSNDGTGGGVIDAIEGWKV